MHATYEHRKTRGCKAEHFSQVKVMLITVGLFWIVNILLLLVSHPVLSKSTLCFTDGDCPSALEKCIYGSWKGLGSCHRKPNQPAKIKIVQHTSPRKIIMNRRLIRRKRNPSTFWNDPHMTPKLRQAGLPGSTSQINEEGPGQFSSSALNSAKANEEFYGIISDLITTGRSYVSFEGKNMTLAIVPSTTGTSDWFLMLMGDRFKKEETDKMFARDYHRLDELYNIRQKRVSSFKNSGIVPLFRNDVSKYFTEADNVPKINAEHSGDLFTRRTFNKNPTFHKRFRRHLLLSPKPIGSLDPLVNNIKQIEPVIPAAENAFKSHLGKRSTSEAQRIRRELDIIEEEAKPLPKVLKVKEDRPIAIEEFFYDEEGDLAIRKKRHHKPSEVNFENSPIMRVMHSKDAISKRSSDSKQTGLEGVNSFSQIFGTSRRLSRRAKSRKQSSPSKRRSAHLKKGRGASRSRKALKTKRKLKQKPEKNKKRKRSKKKKEVSSEVTEEATQPEVDAPDPFADRQQPLSLHIDYYDVNKRDLLKGDEDFDPELAMDSDFLEDEDMDVELSDKRESRKKRQTVAEAIEDDDQEEIPSWKQTMELLRRANTFAVPAHDSNGHFILVRKVRDLGSLDLSSALSKLKETMAKIFGRCSPSRRRKRSHQQPTEVVTDELSDQETWEIQGEGDEVVDQAKLDVEMEEDKPYNVTAVLRPMGKRSNSITGPDGEVRGERGDQNTRYVSKNVRKMRDLFRKNTQANKIKDLKSFEGNLEATQPRHDAKMLGRNRRGNVVKVLAPLHQQYLQENDALDSQSDEVLLMPNKDVHFNTPAGSPISVQLEMDRPQSQPKPAPPEVVIEEFSKPVRSAAIQRKYSTVRTRNAAKLPRAQSVVQKGKRFQKSVSDIASKRRRRKLHERHTKCADCRSLGKSAIRKISSNQITPKTVREPYIITRYNTSKSRPVRSEVGLRRTRELSGTEDLDGVSLLYLADGDALPAALQEPMPNVKRDVSDASAEFGIEVSLSSSEAPMVENDIVKEVDDDVVIIKAGDETDKVLDSKEDTLTITSDDNFVPMEDAKTVILGDRVVSPLPRTVILNKAFVPPPTKTVVFDDEVVPPMSKTVVLDNGVVSNDPLSGAVRVVKVPTIWDKPIFPAPEQVVSTPVINSDGSVRRIESKVDTISSTPIDWSLSGTSDRLMGLISDIEKALRVPLGGSETIIEPVPIEDDINEVKTTVVKSQPELMEQKSSYVYSAPDPGPVFITKQTQTQPVNVEKVDITSTEIEDPITISDVNRNVIVEESSVPKKPVFIDSVAKGMTWFPRPYKTVVSAARPFPYRTVAAAPSPFLTVPNRAFVSVYGDGFLRQRPQIQITEIKDVQPPKPDKDMTVKVTSSVKSGKLKSDKTAVISSPTVQVHVDGDEGGNSSVINKTMSPEDKSIHEEALSGGSANASLGSQGSSVQKEKEKENVPVKRSSMLSIDGIVLSPEDQEIALNEFSNLHNKRESSMNALQKLKSVNGFDASEQSKTSPTDSSKLVHVYSKDPGIQGATNELLKSLAAKIASENSQKRKAQPAFKTKTSCEETGGLCFEKKIVQPSERELVFPRKKPGYILPFNTPKVFGSGNSKSVKRLQRRDVSSTVFEKPKMYVSGQNTIYEKPGSRYQIKDRLERSSAFGKHDTPNELEDASTMKEAHKAALGEAAKTAMSGQFGYKVLDSDAGFSHKQPTFGRIVTSGGEISEDLMRKTKLPFSMEKEIQMSQENDIIKPIAAVINWQAFKDMNNAEAEKKQLKSKREVESVNFISSNSKNLNLKNEHPADKQSRRKRKLSSKMSQLRAARANAAKALRSELQNLNKISSKLDLNLFSRSPIDRVVREEKKHAARGKKNAQKHRFRKSASSKHSSKNLLNKNTNSILERNKSPNKRQAKTQILLEELEPLNTHQNRKQPLELYKEVQRETDDFDQDDSESVPGPRYKYRNSLNNEDSLQIPNPEKFDFSNGRIREEKIKFESDAKDPVEVSAVLRGKRRKRSADTPNFALTSKEMRFQRSMLKSDTKETSAAPGVWVKESTRGRSNKNENVKHDEVFQLAQESLVNREKAQKTPSIFTSENILKNAIDRDNGKAIRDNDVSLSIPTFELLDGQQLTNEMNSQKYVASVGKQPSIKPALSDIIIEERDTAAQDVPKISHGGTVQRKISQPQQRGNGNNGTSPNAKSVQPATVPHKPKSQEGVWKKLGEIFDFGPSATVPTTPSPTNANALQRMVPGEDAIRSGPLAAKTEEQDVTKSLDQKLEEDSAGEHGKSSLRAAIVDRLLHDLREMSSARGSEMRRAESDLIEILHDYQTDLLEEDEQSVAGEPFQGVRIHDSVAIPVVYQSAPIKLQSLSPHRLTVRSSGPRRARAHRRHWSKHPFNPP